jgi:hypothetical protein
LGAGGLLLANGAVTVEAVVQIDVLSNGTDTYTLVVGLNDNLAGAIGTDVVAFRYTHSENSGNWTCVTRNNSTETTLDSGVAAVAGGSTGVAVATNWVNLRFIVNAAATSVTYYVNGTSVGSIATNIPAARQTWPAIYIRKSAGTTARYAFIDLFEGIYDLTTSR